MSKPFTYSSPDQERVFTKFIGQPHILCWCATRESNGYMVWRGECQDKQPWEESEWKWSVEAFHYSRDSAIETALVSAQAEAAELSKADKEGGE